MTNCACCNIQLEFLSRDGFKLGREYGDNISCVNCALGLCFNSAFHAINNKDKENLTYWSDKFNFILENYKKKCMTPCIPRPMIGCSWTKELGYSSPCYCAFKRLFERDIMYPKIEYEIDDLFIKTNTYSYVT
jgi:hypothetical protein